MAFGKREGPKELPIPGEAFGADSKEVLRAWIVNRGLQISLSQAFEDPGLWGIMLVDVARHAARVYAAEGTMSEAAALERIKSLFDAEWNNATDPGTTGQARQ
jgi:hypothetical protein